MKKLFTRGAAVTAAVVGAVATVSALPSTASAQSYYDCNRGGNTAAGAIIGGAAGALIGREIGRGNRYGYGYRYRRGGDGTVGAIIGGAAGALIGREIGRSC